MQGQRQPDVIDTTSLVNISETNRREDAIAVRSFGAALQTVLHRLPDDILPEWSTDDLTVLLANIIRYQCNRSGVEMFAKKAFKDTTADDIMDAINKLRQINSEASKIRFILPKPGQQPSFIDSEKPNEPTIFQSSEPPPSDADASTVLPVKCFADWSAGATLASRTRRVFDETPTFLPKIVVNTLVDGDRLNVPISRSPFSRVNNLTGAPNYERIYQHFGSMLSSRCLSKARSLDAAILLNILDDLDEDTDQFVQHVDFFRSTFDEMSKLDPSEFKIDFDVDEHNFGSVSSNPLGFPPELLDLSAFLPCEVPSAEPSMSVKTE